MRYRDVPLEDMMEDILDAYLMSYKSDFQIDLEQMSKCESCIWIWLVRRYGTYLFPLTNCFTKKHFGHTAILYYADTELDDTQTFIVEQKGNMRGDVYNITLDRLREIVEANAVDVEDIEFDEKMSEAMNSFKKEYRKQQPVFGWERLAKRLASNKRNYEKRTLRRMINEQI